MGFLKRQRKSNDENSSNNNESNHYDTSNGISKEIEMEIFSIKAGRKNDAGFTIYNEEIPMYETYYKRVLILKERKGVV